MDEIKSYILSYLQVDKDGNPLMDAKATTEEVDSSVLNYELKDLEPEVRYEIIVYVSNTEGQGPGSEPAYVTIEKDNKDNLPRKYFSNNFFSDNCEKLLETIDSWP